MNGDAFTGSLTRISGEDVGSYAITRGTLAANGNYTVTFTGNSLVIGKATTVTTVTGGAHTYTAAAHGAASGSVSGANLLTVPTSLSSSGTRADGTVYAPTTDAPTDAGTYTVLATYAGDARATYTGLLYVTTSSASSSTATVVLPATVQDITAVTGDPAYDAFGGDIRNATVTFVNRDTGAVIADNVPVGLVSAADTKTGTATFTSKANVTDITNPLAPISLGGNKALQIQMTDKGEPGSADTIAVTLTDPSDGLLFSSRWDGAKSVEQLLGGGNLQVRPALQAAATGGAAGGETAPTAGQLAPVVRAAKARWLAAGLTVDQRQALDRVNAVGSSGIALNPTDTPWKTWKGFDVP